MGNSTSRYHPDAVGPDTLPWQPIANTVPVQSVQQPEAAQRMSQVGPIRTRPSSTTRIQPRDSTAGGLSVDTATHAAPSYSPSILSRVSLQPRDEAIPEETEEAEGHDEDALQPPPTPSDRGHTPTPLPEPLAEALRAGLGTATGRLASVSPSSSLLSPPVFTRKDTERRGTGETDRERLLAYWATMDKDSRPSSAHDTAAAPPPSGQGWTSEWSDTRGGPALMSTAEEEDDGDEDEGSPAPVRSAISNSSLLSAAAASSSCDPDLSSQQTVPTSDVDATLSEFGVLKAGDDASPEATAAAAHRHTLLTLNTLSSARSSHFSETTALHSAIDQLRAGPTPQIDRSASDFFADEPVEHRKKGSFHLMDKLMGRVRRSSEARQPPSPSTEDAPDTPAHLERALSGSAYNFPSMWPRAGSRQRAVSAAAQLSSPLGGAADGLSSGMSDTTARPPNHQRTIRRSLLRRRKTSEKVAPSPIPVSTIVKRRSAASIGKRSPRSKRSSVVSLRSIYRAGERGELGSGANTPSTRAGSQGRGSLRRSARPSALWTSSVRSEQAVVGGADRDPLAETPLSSPPASMRLADGPDGPWEDVEDSSDARPAKAAAATASAPRPRRPWSWSKRVPVPGADAWTSHSRSASEKEHSQPEDTPAPAPIEPEPLARVEHHHGDEHEARIKSPTESFSSLKPTPKAGPVPPPRRQVRRKANATAEGDSMSENSPTDVGVVPQLPASHGLRRMDSGEASALPSAAEEGPRIEPMGMVTAALEEDGDEGEGQEVVDNQAYSADSVGGRRSRAIPAPSLSPVQELGASFAPQKPARRPLPTPPAHADPATHATSAYASVDASSLAGQTSTGSFRKHAGEDLGRRRIGSAAGSEASITERRAPGSPSSSKVPPKARGVRSASLDSASVPPAVSVRPGSRISDRSDSTTTALPAPSPARPVRATSTRTHALASSLDDSPAQESLRNVLPRQVPSVDSVGASRQRTVSAPVPHEDALEEPEAEVVPQQLVEREGNESEDQAALSAAPFAGTAVQASLAALAALEDKDVDDPSVAWRRERLLGGSAFLDTWLARGTPDDASQTQHSGRPRRRAKPYTRRRGTDEEDTARSSSGTELTGSAARPPWASPSRTSARRRREREEDYLSTGPRGHFLHPTDIATLGASSSGRSRSRGSLRGSLRESLSREEWDGTRRRRTQSASRLRADSASLLSPPSRPAHSREPTGSTMYEDALELLPSAAQSIPPSPSPSMRARVRSKPQQVPSVLAPAPVRLPPAPSVQEWDEMIVPALRKRLAEEQALEEEMARAAVHQAAATEEVAMEPHPRDDGPVPFPTQYSPEHSRVVHKLAHLAARERSKTIQQGLGMGYPGQSEEDVTTWDVAPGDAPMHTRTRSLATPLEVRPDSRIGKTLHAEVRYPSYDSPLDSHRSRSAKRAPKGSPLLYAPSLNGHAPGSSVAQLSISSRRADAPHKHASSRHANTDARQHRSRTTSLSSRPVPSSGTGRSKRPAKQGFSGEDIQAWLGTAAQAFGE